MTEIKTTTKGLKYLAEILKTKNKTITRAIFWKIPHNTDKEDIALKIGRYNKTSFNFETLENENPKSELTLDNEELTGLMKFLSENYEPLKSGVKRYIPLDEAIDLKSTNHLKAIFANPDKQELLNYVATNDILPDELIRGLEYRKKVKAIEEFEEMLKENLVEAKWQAWFQENDWVLGSEFVRIIDEREIDTQNISDYLMQAYDGFLDVIEIKRPEGGLKFWSNIIDHSNYIPSTELVKAITQSQIYIYEIEREANSVKFSERVGDVKTIKPRGMLIFGRSDDWNSEQKIAYRILNSGFHNLTVLTYDHVLARAKRILDIKI